MKIPAKYCAIQLITLLGLLGAAGGAIAQDWVSQSSMKVARVEATTVDYRGDIYVFNGFKPNIKIADSVEKYDVATRQWSIISSTSVADGSAVTHNGIVRVGADVWIIGGRIGSHPGRVSDKVWIYNLDNGNWRRGPDLPIGGAAGGAALVNNKVHWFGGLDIFARCDVRTHLVYDLESPSEGWQNITSDAGMPVPRNHFSTAVVDEVIYAIGGQFGHGGCPGTSTQDSPLVHAFDTSTNTWSRMADMPKRNSHSEPGTFVYKGDIYTTGGETETLKVWKYNPRKNNWSTFATLPEKLVAPIARIVDGELIVAGGGAPTARQATDRVRSLFVDDNPLVVDNNPPAQQPTPEPQPEPQPEPPQEPVPGSGTPAGPTLISMEAEYFDVDTATSSHQWVRVALANSSNDDAMTTTPDQGSLAGSTEDTPMLSYMVYFNHPGKHYIWVRGLGDSNVTGGGNSDSIQIGLNGTLADTAYRIDQFPDEWTWSRHTPSDPVASLNVVTAGVNMINFWMREDGLAIDKFVITSDPDFVPTGKGPDVTDGSEGYVPPVSSEDSNAGSSTGSATNDDATDADTTSEEPATADLVNETTDPVNDDAVELVNDDLIVIDTVDSDPANDDSPSAEPIELVTTDTGDSIPRTDQSETANTATRNESSNNGLFGGSASTMGLLALVLIGVARSTRQRRIV